MIQKAFRDDAMSAAQIKDILVYVHCPGVIVSGAHFHSQKVLAKFACPTLSQLHSNQVF